MRQYEPNHFAVTYEAKDNVVLAHCMLAAEWMHAVVSVRNLVCCKQEHRSFQKVAHAVAIGESEAKLVGLPGESLDCLFLNVGARVGIEEHIRRKAVPLVETQLRKDDVVQKPVSVVDSGDVVQNTAKAGSVVVALSDEAIVDLEDRHHGSSEVIGHMRLMHIEDAFGLEMDDEAVYGCDC